MVGNGSELIEKIKQQTVLASLFLLLSVSVQSYSLLYDAPNFNAQFKFQVISVFILDQEIVSVFWPPNTGNNYSMMFNCNNKFAIFIHKQCRRRLKQGSTACID